MLRTLLIGALLLVFGAPLLAQDEVPELKPGDAAVDIEPHSWINPPAFKSFDELKGDVILIKAWGLN